MLRVVRQLGISLRPRTSVPLAAAVFVLIFGASACSTDGTATDGKRATKAPAVAKAATKTPPKGAPKAGSGTSLAAPKTAGAGQSLPQLSGAHHSVFSLVDNRALAHVQRAGGVVALGNHAGVA